MGYTTTQLITQAYYLSGIVSPILQTVQGFQITDGLTFLNQVLSLMSVNMRNIPYYTELDVPLVQGQEEYSIPGLLQADVFTFNIGDLRYQSYPLGRKDYFASTRVDNVQALPMTWHIERTLNGANLFIYFVPAGAYGGKIWGRFAWPTIVSLAQDLTLTFEQNYILYITYELASYICNYYNYAFPVMQMKKLEELREAIMDVSPADLEIQKTTMFPGQSGLTYADVNIGHLIRPI